ncbi:MAG: diphosphomevalonate decarboxylase [Chloroflexi bacterium]|nr:MAG: diphosphomevalonate decarboxylase [Chloroflexota bacterium]
MPDFTATALAHPNIAFIKYWGNRDDVLRLPQNGSISMNLAGLHTHTRVSFDPSHEVDTFSLNNQAQFGAGLERVSRFLDIVRTMAGKNWRAQVESANNFPTGAGIASSAAAFAALAVAASQAIGLELTESQLSALARRGSGSACRSIPAGFVEWRPGTKDADSYAISLAPPAHWDLVDCIAILKETHKMTGSSEGHRLAGSSPLQQARVASSRERLDRCRQAVLTRDFDALTSVIELDSNLMHAVMMTSTPSLFYWEPASLEIMKAVPEWRRSGLPVCYTLDAGPNVHLLCPGTSVAEVRSRLEDISGILQVLTAAAGGEAHITAGD